MKWTKCLPCVILFLVLVIALKTLGGYSGYADSSILSIATGSAGALMNTAPTSTLMNTAPTSTLTTPVPSAPIVASLAAMSSIPKGVKRVCYDMS